VPTLPFFSSRWNLGGQPNGEAEMRFPAGLRAAGLVLALGLCLLLGGPAAGEDLSEYGNPWLWVRVGRVQVQAEVVKTPEKLSLGLGRRRELPHGRGMLFFMPRVEVQHFCMRGMQFPLDFIWIVQGQVAGLEKNVSPAFPGTLSSPRPVNYVLEVPAGFADTYGVKVGDEVKW
jgi:uncharacterized membrane protein (UPF0127 family)